MKAASRQGRRGRFRGAPWGPKKARRKVPEQINFEMLPLSKLALENVVFAWIHAALGRLPPSRRQSSFKVKPL